MARAGGRKAAEPEEDDVLLPEDAHDDGAAPAPAAAPRRRKPRARRTPPAPPPRAAGPRRLILRGLVVVVAIVVGVIALFGIVNPPTTPYMWSEGRRLGGVEQAWVPMEEIAPIMARAAVAAEDANFCNHWGLDVAAIRLAMASGGERGASTISQQVVKNVFLWQGRSWVRKSIEAGLTPVMEALWTKRRILEVYLNVAEFGDGVFGIEAAARHWFDVPASRLSEVQAARLAAILPSPKTRNPADPSPQLRARARAILQGAATIAADGRAACFEGAGP